MWFISSNSSDCAMFKYSCICLLSHYHDCLPACRLLVSSYAVIRAQVSSLLPWQRTYVQCQQDNYDRLLWAWLLCSSNKQYFNCPTHSFELLIFFKISYRSHSDFAILLFCQSVILAMSVIKGSHIVVISSTSTLPFKSLRPVTN